ncbi:G-PROTEIN-RECEP-F3-4 domain-containing protein [Aphelenchoides besseyi]|nr:G-PROTEIN-RECEP-F3-4 domain-containing protein [Aphelenchoides besseyi]
MLYSHVTLLMLRVVDTISKVSVQQSAKMLVAEYHGDIQIGALFPMHRQIAGTEACGAIWEQYGIQRMEMAVLTVAEMNKILPFKLGITIRDSCWTERIAMEQTIAFLREGVQQCSCCQTQGCQKKSKPTVGMFVLSSYPMFYLAIIGPAKKAQRLLLFRTSYKVVFRIPQIGYGATTTDLSDKEQFGFFLRTVPSDLWQARAIMELLKHFNWTYIAVVYSAGNYGEKGFEAMESIRNTGVCIAHTEKVKSLGDLSEFITVLKKLGSLKPRPQVVVCFCEGQSVRKMFRAQKELRKRVPELHTFQWIASDSWADRLDVVEGVEQEAAGSFSFRIHSPVVESFKPHYFSLNPINHTKNPWFREFWQQKFRCQLTVPKDDVVTPVCTGKENLTTQYEQDPKLSQVINSVRVVALALKALHQDRCKDYSNMTAICPEMEQINGSLLFRYMMNITYVDSFNQEISFDSNGDPPAWYDILNYIGKKGFKHAGNFRQLRSGKHYLNMTTSEPIMFYDKTSRMPESVCSKPCHVGQRPRKTTECCWICETCADHQFVNYTSNKCQDCPLGFWPNASTRISCHPITHEYLRLSSPPTIAALVFATLGILVTFLTLLIFVNHNSTPVVKSTTRELSYTILGGIIACYATTFAILAKPSFFTCFVTRIMPPISFAIIYSALLTKTNRIARILAGSKKRILTKKPRFLSTFSQVVITWALVGIQCVIVAVSAMQEMPAAGFNEHLLPRRMMLVCKSSNTWFMIPFLWNFFLIILCTVYAFKTRNLPENFNEAKFIGFTMYCTVVVWGAFVVLYLGTVNKALTMSFTFSISATIALGLLFFHKIYIILFQPEKNVRASYTTTKLIRCHFGNSQGLPDSKHASSKTRASSQSISTGYYPTRTASLHIMNQSSSNASAATATISAAALPISHSSRLVDATTQTESATSVSRFTRAFSVMGAHAGGQRRKTMEEDVLNLIDSCRRYQDERLNSTAIVQNMLLEENLEDEDTAASAIANTIEKGMRSVLSTVSRASPGFNVRDTTKLLQPPPTSRMSGSNLRHRSMSASRQKSEDGANDQDTSKEVLEATPIDETVLSADDRFEQLLRSRGVEPVHLSNATQL